MLSRCCRMQTFTKTTYENVFGQLLYSSSLVWNYLVQKNWHLIKQVVIFIFHQRVTMNRPLQMTILLLFYHNNREQYISTEKRRVRNVDLTEFQTIPKTYNPFVLRISPQQTSVHVLYWQVIEYLTHNRSLLTEMHSFVYCITIGNHWCKVKHREIDYPIILGQVKLKFSPMICIDEGLLNIVQC